MYQGFLDRSTLNGLRVILDPNMVDVVYAPTRRRFKVTRLRRVRKRNWARMVRWLGKRKRVPKGELIQVGGRLIAHPAYWEAKVRPQLDVALQAEPRGHLSAYSKKLEEMQQVATQHVMASMERLLGELVATHAPKSCLSSRFDWTAPLPMTVTMPEPPGLGRPMCFMKEPRYDWGPMLNTRAIAYGAI